jgi:hypothetical protein
LLPYARSGLKLLAIRGRRQLAAELPAGLVGRLRDRDRPCRGPKKEKIMAKGQKRSTKEARKPKSTDKKAGPKYLGGSNLGDAAKSAATRLGQKK